MSTVGSLSLSNPNNEKITLDSKGNRTIRKGDSTVKEKQKTENENKFTTVIIWIIVGIIIFFIFLGIVNYFIRDSVPALSPADYQEQYLPFAFWGPSTADEDTDRNSCKLYQFNASNDASLGEISGVPISIPAQPSRNTDIVDQIEPQPPTGCYDIDQQILVKADHSCIELENLVEGDFTGENAQGEKGVSFCTKQDGTIANIGDTEKYYTTGATLILPSGGTSSITCTQQRCEGILGLIGLDYSTVDQGTGEAKSPVTPTFVTTGGDSDTSPGLRCLRTDGAGNFTMETCDITDKNQLFRIFRSDYGKPLPPASSGQRGSYGNTAQIYSRVDKQCVIPNPDTENAPIGTNAFSLGACAQSWGLINRQYGESGNIAVQQMINLDALTDDQKSDIMNERNSDKLFDLMDEYNVKSIVLEDNENEGISDAVFRAYSYFPSNEYVNLNDIWSAQIVDYTIYNNTIFGTNFLPLN